MNKKYGSTNFQSNNPFDIALIKDNGELEEYYILDDGVKEKNHTIRSSKCSS